MIVCVALYNSNSSSLKSMFLEYHCLVETLTNCTSVLGYSSSNSSSKGLIIVTNSNVMKHTASNSDCTKMLWLHSCECKIWKDHLKIPNDLSMIDLII